MFEIIDKKVPVALTGRNIFDTSKGGKVEVGLAGAGEKVSPSKLPTCF